MSSSRPARKRHSTVFYRDEQFEKPITKRRNSLPTAASIIDNNDTTTGDIPEVLFAPDGRKFFPCKYCCKAFAFKKAQISHIKHCGFKRGNVKVEDTGKINKNVTSVERKLPNFNEAENLLKPVKFEAVSSCPELSLVKQKMKKHYIKRTSADFSGTPLKRIKQEFEKVATTTKMPVLKPMATPKNQKKPLNNSVSERMKKLESVSLIPLQQKSVAKKLQMIDIHKPTCCKQCGHIFPNAYGCLKHKQQVHLNGSMQVSPDSLKVYNTIFLSSDRSVCPICSKPTKTNSWNRHLLTHSAQKNYMCDYCKKDFHRKDHLKNHLRTHGVFEEL